MGKEIPQTVDFFTHRIWRQILGLGQPVVGRGLAQLSHRWATRVGQVHDVDPAPPDDEPSLNPDDVAHRYAADSRPARKDRPWVMLNMVTSLDGATAVDGTSGGLGGEGDKMAFRAIRAVADLIMVGAGTAMAENYGPPVLTAELRAARVARGQSELPAIAVVSRRLSLDPAARLFADESFDPFVITTSTDGSPEATATKEALATGATVMEVGDDQVDLAAALSELRQLGFATVLLEGGPTLNASFIELDLIDELMLTLAPSLVAGASTRLATGPIEAVRPMRLDRALAHEDNLFLRYVRQESHG